MNRLRQLVSALFFSPVSVWLQSRLLAGLARLVGPVSPVVASRAERIVVIKLDRVGDFVLATPFLRELRRCHPHAWIVLVATESVRALAAPCPYVDETIFIPPLATGPRDAHRRWRERISLAWERLLPLRATLAILPRWDVDLYGGYALLAFTGASRRLSYSTDVNLSKARRNRGADRLLTDAVSQTRGIHEVERNLALLSVTTEPIDSHLELWPRHDADAICARFLPGADNHVLIAVCPTSAEAVKDWPLERFLAVVRRFADRPRTTFVLLAGPESAAIGKRPDVRSIPNLVSLAGCLSLDETAAFLGRCDLVLSVDTGLMHMAAALQRPLIVVCALGYGDDPESHYSPERFGPWRHNATLVTPKVSDSSPRRIDAVTVEQVVEAVVARLTPS